MDTLKLHRGKGPIEKPYLSADLPSNQFYPQLQKKIITVTKLSGMLKLVITLLVNKLNVVKTLKSWKVIFRFTAACSLFTLIYHLCRRLIRQYKSKNFNICRDLEVTIACGLASIGLHIASKGDLAMF